MDTRPPDSVDDDADDGDDEDCKDVGSLLAELGSGPRCAHSTHLSVNGHGELGLR